MRLPVFLQLKLKQRLDFFWKPVVPFSCFFSMSIFLWCTTVFIAVVWLLLYVINGAQYWNCSLVALLVSEVCFWPAKLRKNLNSLRCMQVLDLVLNCYSDKKEALLIHFISLHCVADQNGIVSWLNGKNFFHPWVYFQVELFSYFSFTQRFAIGFQNRVD